MNASASLAVKENAQKSKSASQAIVELVPKNPIDSAARALDGEIIPFMIFALIFGMALKIASDKSPKANYLPAIFEQTFDTCMQVIHFAMALAPFGIFALVFNTVFLAGINILFSLFFYILCVILGLLIQQFVVYGALLKFFTHHRPWQFFRMCRETYLYAFSTSSSNATLPKAIETAEQKLHISSDVARFVLTVGASANQNGTAIFEGITVLFLAQVYGVDLSFSQQLYVIIFSILAGIGTAGVPGGSLPLIMVLLKSVGIPAEGIGLILGVDRFLDMCRTTINVSGDLVIAALVDNKAPR
jgi:DAACS family dicarboxylate/amino acid:cation (Na+ or H+) symporter